ncbi:hypothetical protein [Dysosmobacter welbionis]|uniref:hypothetical protein n=1 Tax=Dysosmobacter welbionis TaxID=2093857 RepID=UPI002942E1BD|nr:hypothetical protein [Dysosmobacter welbionis]
MGGPAGGHHHPGPGTEPSGDRPGLGRCGYAPALEVTDGSIFVCTYVRTVADVDSWADMPETSYPEQSERHARFWFSYTRIFVPENEAARSCQMAGNTVEYDGRYGEAPEGAYENFQVGVLYLTDEGWRCDGTGTGP